MKKLSLLSLLLIVFFANFPFSHSTENQNWNYPINSVDDQTSGYVQHSAIQQDMVVKRAMWVWYAEPLLEGWKPDLQEFFDFCYQPHGNASAPIQVIFLATPSEYLLYKQDQLRNFLELAQGTYGLEVHYLHINDKVQGNAWVRSGDGLSDALRTISAVLAFNEGGQNTIQRFQGIHLDIEPAEVPEWENASVETRREIWARFYSNTLGDPGILDYARSQIQIYNSKYPQEKIILGADMVTYNPYYGEDVDGNGNPDYEDVLGRVDYLATMDYIDYAGRTEGLDQRVEKVLAVAKRKNKTVWVGVETASLCHNTNLKPEMTLYEEGRSALEQVAASVNTRYAGRPEYAGIAIHHYASYRMLPETWSDLQDIALIVDSSGSMQSNDPAQIRLQAVKVFINQMRYDEQVTVFHFNDSANLVWPLQPVEVDPDGRTTAIENIPSNGGTDIGAGLAEAYRALQLAPIDHHKAAILLTDGNGEYKDQAEWYQGMGWQVYTIGLGDGPDEELLRKTAKLTCGDYYALQNPEQLIQVYSRIAARMSGGANLFDTTLRLLQGETKFLSVLVTPGQILANFLIIWPGSTVNVTLIAPDGVRIDPTTQDSRIRHLKGTTYEQYVITDPLPGTWQVEIHGADLPEGGEDVTLQVSARGESVASPTTTSQPPMPDTETRRVWQLDRQSVMVALVIVFIFVIAIGAILGLGLTIYLASQGKTYSQPESLSTAMSHQLERKHGLNPGGLMMAYWAVFGLCSGVCAISVVVLSINPLNSILTQFVPVTPTFTLTPSPTFTSTSTISPTPTTTATPTPTLTGTLTQTPTSTPTQTPTPTGTSTSTPTLTPTITRAPYNGLTGKIAFTRNPYGHEPSGHEIYVLDLASGDVNRLTNNSVPDWNPDWSSDGQFIAFTSFQDGNYDIWVMNGDGSGQTNRIALPAWDDYPIWSPDGTQIVFVSTGVTDDVPNSEVFIGSNTDNIRQITFNTGADEWPSWSPNGQWIADSSNRDGEYDIYLFATDGSNMTKWTDESAYDEQPNWSPDGQWITFIRKTEDTNGNGHLDRRDDGDYGNVWIGHRDGTDFRQLTFDNRAADPAWSPDGTYIVFAHFKDSNGDGKVDLNDVSDLWVISVTGGDPIILTQGSELDWSPDWTR